jgi:xylulokinase
MRALLGVDLGTSSVKVAVTDEKGTLKTLAGHEYPILTPQLGYAEQHPDTWWEATCIAVSAALAQAPNAEIAGIGLSGQMHGMVLLDAQGESIGDAIIWADQRSAPQSDTLLAEIGIGGFRTAGTRPATGFMAASLRWLRDHEPARLDRVRHVLLPKDYIRFRLTGEIASEPSDASSTALFDISARDWSDTLIKAVGGRRDIFPPIFESAQTAGQLTQNAAGSLHLQQGIPVAAGAADTAAALLGLGLIQPGIGTIAINTGGTVVMPLAVPRTDPDLRVHTFCHVPQDRWYIQGAMLSAGLSLRWLRDLYGLTHRPDAYDYLTHLATSVPPGSDGLIFLPYLIGERSPLMAPQARSAFVGLTLSHGLGHMVRAVLEGVAFAIRQIVETIGVLDTPTTEFYGAGAGLLSSLLWRQILVDVLNFPLRLPVSQERASVGAALLGGLAAGVYHNYAEAIHQPNYQPVNPIQAVVYEEHYRRFLDVYPRLASFYT